MEYMIPIWLAFLISVFLIVCFSIFFYGLGGRDEVRRQIKSILDKEDQLEKEMNDLNKRRKN